MLGNIDQAWEWYAGNNRYATGIEPGNPWTLEVLWVANGYQGGLNLISRALLADESCFPGGRSQAPERMAGPVPARMRGIADSAPHVIRYPVAYCRVQIVQFGVHRLPPQNAGQAWCNGEDWIQGGAR